MIPVAVRFFEHPILGFLVLHGSSEVGIVALDFASTMPDSPCSDDLLLVQTENLLQRYLLGEPVTFGEIPLAPAGTVFQQAVWQTLTTIPWGVTRSYKWVATQLGKPSASRAIGQANGKNPIPIIIPCHRVVQHDGSLGGYSGGLHIKSFLLSLEQQTARLEVKTEVPYLNAASRAMTLL